MGFNLGFKGLRRRKFTLDCSVIEEEEGAELKKKLKPLETKHRADW